MKLYYSPGSCALASHIALEESGTDYEAIRIDFGSAQQKSPEFLEVNPKGRVPALVTERGILTETPAILFFLAQSFPGVNMAPLEDPFALAEAQSFNSYLCATVHVAHAHKHRGARWADDPAAHAAMTAKVTSNMAIYAGMIEEHYLKGPWVLGDSYSICDPYLALITRWLCDDGVRLADFPRLAAHDALMRTRPSMQAVLPLYD